MILPSNRVNEILQIEDNIKYLELLATKFPTIADAAREIINLEAILNLPKGTEHFMADLHGEDEAFQHVLRNASGVVKTKIIENFAHLSEIQQKELATLIYYPSEKLKSLHKSKICTDKWYRENVELLVKLIAIVSSKYTRSKTRKALPAEFRYILEELLHESVEANPNRNDYYKAIINTMISLDQADNFIIAMCHVIQHLTIDKLHIVGDIYDRGPGAHKIIELLKDYANYDIQWGNHDILWMGAACGNLGCIANVVRICTRYASFETIEDGYGINLLPLARFAMEAYGDDPCICFKPRCDHDNYREKDAKLISQMHKAMTIIQFKIEHQIIEANPEYNCQDRDLLHLINYETGEIEVDGVNYKMLDTYFPTVDRNDPYKLTLGEQSIIDRLKESFLNSEKLQNHINELYEKGSLYSLFNSNLLFHAAVPIDELGNLKSVKVYNEWCRGKKLFDKIDLLARQAFFSKDNTPDDLYAKDYMWYLWCGQDSPLFNKAKMATFERYFLADKEPQAEYKGNYYKRIDDPEICEMILKEFGIRNISLSHIINGHVPVKIINGESPIKAEGRLLVIDGGFAKSYHKQTGTAGFTLIYNSFGMQLVQHEPFTSKDDAVYNGSDIKYSKFLVEEVSNRIRVADTDIGKKLILQVRDIQELLNAYKLGVIKEQVK